MAGTEAVDVHPSNIEALRAWDGDDGAFWVEHEARIDDSVARYHHGFVAAASIARHDHVLDIGCGTGQTTCDAARLAVAGSALGVDLSSAMIGRARRRATDAGITNARFVQADAQVHRFDPGAFDLAVSRSGVMFFGDPVAAFTNIGQAIRPGGRVSLLVWRSLTENEWVVEFSRALAAGRIMPAPPPDAPGAFSLADPGRVDAILSAAGYSDITLDPVDELMCFGADADDAYGFVRAMGFTSFMLRDLGDDARTRALDALRVTIDAHETDDGVLYPSAAWIIRARRA